MEQLTAAQQFTVWVLPILLAITLHEVAHGWVASKLGDPTARILGRLTLNPFKHIDLTGTVIVPALLFTFGGVIFGWAKPVPVQWSNLRHPKRDMALVAAAGPLSNLFMAMTWGGIAKLGVIFMGMTRLPLVAIVYMGQAGLMINVTLMVLNFLPVPPLDGSRVLTSLLPQAVGDLFNKLSPFGFFILLALILSGLLSQLIWPPILLIQNGIASLYGLSLF